MQGLLHRLFPKWFARPCFHPRQMLRQGTWRPGSAPTLGRYEYCAACGVVTRELGFEPIPEVYDIGQIEVDGTEEGKDDRESPA